VWQTGGGLVTGNAREYHVDPEMESSRPRPDLRLVAEPDPADPGWEAVYRATVVMVFRFVHARVGNRPDAEDITTQVYLRALPRLRLLAAPEEIRAYLVATARTVIADHWRRHYDVRYTELDDRTVPGVEIVADGPGAGMRRAAEILNRLPDNYRTILELRFLRGYSIREAAAEMGISAVNARVMQFRALRRAATVGTEVAP
jgi:RNA polymerase sigma factor (sigma-70 family)